MTEDELTSNNRLTEYDEAETRKVYRDVLYSVIEDNLVHDFNPSSKDEHADEESDPTSSDYPEYDPESDDFTEDLKIAMMDEINSHEAEAELEAIIDDEINRSAD